MIGSRFFPNAFFTTLVAASLAGPALDPSPPSTPVDPIVGEWITADKDAVVRIGVEGGRYVGRIAWLKDANGRDGKPARDEKNKTPALRDRPLLGLPILWNLKNSGGREYVDGQLYDPTDGKTYTGSAKLEGPRTLELRAYVGIALFGRTETWTKR